MVWKSAWFTSPESEKAFYIFLLVALGTITVVLCCTTCYKCKELYDETHQPRRGSQRHGG